MLNKDLDEMCVNLAQAVAKHSLERSGQINDYDIGCWIKDENGNNKRVRIMFYFLEAKSNNQST